MPRKSVNFLGNNREMANPANAILGKWTIG